MECLDRRTFLMLAVASGGSLVIGFRGAGAGGWGAPLPRGVGRGFAAGYGSTVFIAQVVEVKVAATGLRIRRLPIGDQLRPVKAPIRDELH